MMARILDQDSRKVNDTFTILETCMVLLVGQNKIDEAERIEQFKKGVCERVDVSQPADVELYIKHWSAAHQKHHASEKHSLSLCNSSAKRAGLERRVQRLSKSRWNKDSQHKRYGAKHKRRKR